MLFVISSMLLRDLYPLSPPDLPNLLGMSSCTALALPIALPSSPVWRIAMGAALPRAVC